MLYDIEKFVFSASEDDDIIVMYCISITDAHFSKDNL